jgi:hypothetical protein
VKGRRGIRPRIARRRIESSERLGRHRWTIERTGAWLGGFRRLRIRYERCAERFYALAMLAVDLMPTLRGPAIVVLAGRATTVPFTTVPSGCKWIPTDNPTATMTCAVRRLAKW